VPGPVFSGRLVHCECRESPVRLYRTSDPLPHHGTDIAAHHLAKAEYEPFLYAAGELVFGDWGETEGLVKGDEDDGRMDVDRLRTTVPDQLFHGKPGIPLPAVLLGCKDAVHLIAIRVLCVPGGCNKVPVSKYAEYPLVCRICLLAPVMLPHLLCQIKLIAFQFTGFRRHGIPLPQNLFMQVTI